MKRQPYSPADPRVIAAAQRFKRNRGKSSNTASDITFERLYTMACDYSIPARDIADTLKISLPSFARMWEEYLMSLCGNMTLAERRQIWVDEQKKQRRAPLLNTLPDYDWMAWLAEEASHAGHTVRPVIGTNRVNTLRSQIHVSGTRVLLAPITAFHKNNEGDNQRWGISQMKQTTAASHPFCIFPIVIPGLKWSSLILPREILLGLGCDSREAIRLCVPLRENAGLQARSSRRLNLNGYYNAWNLIPKHTQ